ncbi:MAG: outer membrane beta-barrel protein [Mariprofundales bacterium]|nr:outer membrane beta-barrel protein [Mariprofundales bacterium]
MKKYLMALIAVPLVLFSGNAFAQSPYVGIGLGAIEMNTGVAKKSALGGFLRLGYDFTDFNRFLGAEFRVGTSARASRAKVDYFLSGFLKLNLELTRQFKGYGLIGATNLKTSYQTASVTRSKTGGAFSFGFGGEYRIDRDLSLAGEWVRYATKADASTLNTSSFSGLDVNGFTLNAAYHF